MTNNHIITRFIEDAGNTAQSFGLGRVTGQIYAFLYFSKESRSLTDMQEYLGISKGSASTCVRQLEAWGAVKKIWIKGDRRDYYQANDWFGKVLKNVLNDAIAKRFANRSDFYQEIENEIQQMKNGEDSEYFIERIAHLKEFEKKAQKAWNNPMVKALLR